MEGQQPVSNSGVTVPTDEDIKQLRHWSQYRQDSQDQLMALHHRPLTEFSQMSVDDKRQALIEWKLQYYGLDLELNHDNKLVPKWWFYKTDKPEHRAQKVRDYEVYMDSLRGAAGFERPEVKTLVQERRRALIEAVTYPTQQSLQDLLHNPGVERFKPTTTTDPVANNTRTLELFGAAQYYPGALLYNLLNDPPDFLKRDKSSTEQTVKGNTALSKLTPREQIFIHWLKDAAETTPDGWLTLEAINERNNLLSAQKKVFKPRINSQVTSNPVRQLVAQLRKRPEYTKAIEPRLKIGNAWRFTN